MANDEHSCAMHLDCVAYVKHSIVVQCIGIKLLLISIVVPCIGIKFLYKHRCALRCF